MKNRNEKMKVSILTVAVQGALIAMFATPAFAADGVSDEVAALKRPTSTVEIGVANTSKASAKFGEYSGLDEKGAGLVGNFILQGGDDGEMRWVAKGTDIGTTSRSFEGSLNNQGQWNVGVGYDELRHNMADTYQTPQQGSMGGNVFTFPANFGTINGGTTPATNPSARVLDATQLSAFHTEKVGTTRKNSMFNAGYTFSPELSLQFDFNHLVQSGAKLMSVGTAGGVANPAGGTWRAEAVNIIMNPTNYKTDTFTLALNWAGEKGHVTGSYYGSIFSDGYDSVSSQSALRNAATFGCASGGTCAYQTTLMSTAPDNSLHQLNLSGGYTFSPETKLVGGVSYGRNTQNNSYLSGVPEISASPRASLNGLVVTTHADMKLTNQTIKDLTLSAGFKYNQRENRSPSDLYKYFAINSVVVNATTGIGVDAAANAPYSNKKTQIELAADYRIAKGQNVRLAFENEQIKRWCASYEVTTANCLVNPSNSENKVGVNYRVQATEDVKLNAGYTYANRAATQDGEAVTPLAGLDVATGGHDVNAQNYPGYIAYPYAARKQNLVKAGVNWQATESLDVGLNGRYVADKYDATLGVQDGKTTGVNLDTTYTYIENASVSVYVSQQNSDRSLKAGAAPINIGTTAVPVLSGVGQNVGTSYAALIAPTNIWTNQLKDTNNTIGLVTNHEGLLGGKLTVVGDLSYSMDKSRYSTQVPYRVATNAAPANTCDSPLVLTCGSAPDIQTKIVTLKINSSYQIDKDGKVAVIYVHQRMNSSDYFYNGEQYGYTPNRVMPTNLQAPNYAINAVAVSYSYTF